MVMAHIGLSTVIVDTLDRAQPYLIDESVNAGTSSRTRVKIQVSFPRNVFRALVLPIWCLPLYLYRPYLIKSSATNAQGTLLYFKAVLSSPDP